MGERVNGPKLSVFRPGFWSRKRFPSVYSRNPPDDFREFDKRKDRWFIAIHGETHTWTNGRRSIPAKADTFG
jgi:hypothetical protein